MDNSILLTTALLFNSVTSVMSLACYQCTIRPPQDVRKPTRLCSKFDYSDQFIVDCPMSTFCMKKTFRYPLQNSSASTHVDIALRDCAQQKEEYQVLRDGSWTLDQVVQADAYSNGCFKTDNREGIMVNSIQYCYCDTHLCNAGKSSKDSPPHHTDIMTVIFVFNAMKYIRSMR